MLVLLKVFKYFVYLMLIICKNDTVLVHMHIYFALVYMVSYHRYEDADFTKQPERCLKYSPQQVEQMIQTLFDMSA